jgi:4-hydroxy-tetrahydrodipicolinate reductase
MKWYRFAPQKWRFHLSSNFSLGVNIFFEINEYLAKMMAKLDHYSIEMEEIHHTQKLDAPSGTAISLKGVIENSKYTLGPRLNQLQNQIHIEAKIATVPGTQGNLQFIG